MNARVTVSLPQTLLAAAERVGRRRGLRSRSAVVVAALESLVREVRDAQIDEELDAYYRTQTTAERAEHRALQRAFQRSRRRLNLDRDR